MRQKQWIVMGALIAGLIALLWLSWSFLLSPVKKKIRLAVDEKIQVEADLADAKAKKNQYDKFQASAENLRRNHLFLTRRLEPQVRVNELYQHLNSLGTQLGLTSFRFESNDSKRVPTKLNGVSGMDEQLFVFTFKGRYNHVGEFINSAHSLDRLLVAEKMILTVWADPRGKETVDAKIEVKLYLETKKEGVK